MNLVKQQRTIVGQKIANFTGEGAYHGSTKDRNKETFQPVVEDTDEMTPYTIIEKEARNFFLPKFFDATFPNFYQVRKVMPIPTQEEIMGDGVTFVWALIDDAIQEAGPLTKSVLLEMKNYLEGKKKFVYIDSKIQYFKKDDVPVDSRHWHVDGTIAIRGDRAKKFGSKVVHDMQARFTHPDVMPKYMAYQSSIHCATQFVTKPLSIVLPDIIPNFSFLDQEVDHYGPVYEDQPPGSIVSFDGLSLHRAVKATDDGWRLWIRCMESDREIKISPDIINCYGTVYR